jgi:integrase
MDKQSSNTILNRILQPNTSDLSQMCPAACPSCRKKRIRDGAAPKTINLEIGTVRAILRRYRLWANLQPDVRMLATRDDIGKALSLVEEKKLLDGCAESRSRSLLPAVLLALNTGMRYSELSLLRWKQVDLSKRTVLEAGGVRDGELTIVGRCKRPAHPSLVRLLRAPNPRCEREMWPSALVRGQLRS